MRALVTGASSGIGLAFARLLAADGYDLLLSARSKKQLRNVAEDLEQEFSIDAEVFSLDLSVQGAADQLLEQAGGVDVLINNAGFGDFSSLVDADWEKLQAMITLNMEAVTRLAQGCAQDMKQRGSGRILNVASVAAFMPGPYMAVYHASKAYVLSFSHALAEELVEHDVTVTCLCPGPTKTGFAQEAGAQKKSFFQGNLPGPDEVAAYGYKALLRGKRTAVPGLKNKLNVFLTRLLPRSWQSRILRRVYLRSREV